MQAELCLSPSGLEQLRQVVHCCWGLCDDGDFQALEMTHIPLHDYGKATRTMTLFGILHIDKYHCSHSVDIKLREG